MLNRDNIKPIKNSMVKDSFKNKYAKSTGITTDIFPLTAVTLMPSFSVVSAIEKNIPTNTNPNKMQ